MIPDGTEQQVNSSEKPLDSSSGAAECPALDTGLAIVIDAWPVLCPRSHSIIASMARKAIEKAAADRS
jgi:hypothetical protein